MYGWCTYKSIKTTGGKKIFEPRIKIRRIKLESGFSVRYPGMMLDRKCFLVDHATYIRKLIPSAARIMWTWRQNRKFWGSYTTKPLICHFLNEAETWGERLELDGRSSFLLGISRACRTTSNIAIKVLTGCASLYLAAKA